MDWPRGLTAAAVVATGVSFKATPLIWSWLLVQSVMSVGGQGRSLPGFKVHDVFSHRAAIQRQRRLSRLGQQGDFAAWGPHAPPGVSPSEPSPAASFES
jgi:hypothetical protein